MSAFLVSLCVLSVCFHSASALAGQAAPLGGNEERKHEFQLPAEQRFLRFLPSPEVIGPGTSSTEPPGASAASGSYHVLPVFVHAAAPLVDAEIFRPGTGDRRLPDHVASLLLLPPPAASPVGTARNPRGVEVWCGRSKISVRVNKRTLGFKSPASRLFLGSCGVSRSTKRYHYFHYGLSECGAARTTDSGRLVFSNSLRYVPERRGAVLRALPVSLRVRCVYNRFHYAYKVGYLPEVRKHTVLKSLRSKRRFTLTAYNAQWEKLAPGKGYVLGHPMYFEARAAFIPRNKRVFVNSCYASPSKEPSSVPQMDVVKNFGCMVDSKRRRSQSKFLSHKSKALRFTVDAFVFPKISAKYLYLHCSITVGNYAPTPVTKSCNFNRRTKRWQELYGSSSVCSCCDSVCEARESAESTMTTNGPWMVINTDQDVVVVPVNEERSVKIGGVLPGVGQAKEVLEAAQVPLEVMEEGEPSAWQEDGQEEEMDEHDKE